MKIIRIAYTPEQNRKKIDSLEQEIKDVKNDLRDLKSEVKKLSKSIDSLDKSVDSLNIGERRFWQAKTIFTSLERKLERFEKVEREWEKYKSEIEDEIKRKIEKSYRASIQKPTAS